MSYEPNQEPSWRSPEISQRAADGLWVVWLWKPLPMEAIIDADPWANAHAWANGRLESAPWITKRYSWQPAGVFGSRYRAERWLVRRAERMTARRQRRDAKQEAIVNG